MAMNKQTAFVVFAVVGLVVAGVSAGGALAATAPPGTSTTPSMAGDCQTSVKHDAFRNDNETVEQLKNNSKAESIVENTRVVVADASGFYRVTGENPNGYCVNITVTVSEDAMPPAQIPGVIESNDGNHQATWEAIHDFNKSETYTKVQFTLPPNTTATFAPSQARVMSLSWASERTEKAQSVADRVKKRIFGGDLAQKQYTIDPDGEQTVTVPLKNPDTGEKVTEWQAMYTTDGGQSWNTLTRDTTEPVYIVESTEDQVTFKFSDPNAKVRFTANPGFTQEAKHEVREYLSGIPDFFGGGNSSQGVLLPPTLVIS